MATIQSAQSGSWSQTGTWVGGVVPNLANDDVVIVAGHAVGTQGNVTVGVGRGVTIHGTLNGGGGNVWSLNGGTITIGAGGAWNTNGDNPTFTAGTFNVHGAYSPGMGQTHNEIVNIFVGGVFNSSSSLTFNGAVQHAGRIVAPNGSTVTISGSFRVQAGARVELVGTAGVKFTASANVQCDRREPWLFNGSTPCLNYSRAYGYGPRLEAI